VGNRRATRDKTARLAPRLVTSARKKVTGHLFAGPAHTTLPVLGCFMGVIKRGEESSSQEIFVVTGARLALLGRPAIETLKIVQKVNAVEAEEVKEKFSLKVLENLMVPITSSSSNLTRSHMQLVPPGEYPFPFFRKSKTNSPGWNRCKLFLKWMNQLNGVPEWWWSQKPMAKSEYAWI